MKKSDEIRRKTWRMIAKNLIVLAALAVAAVIGVMSWFTTKSDADASGLSVECGVPDGLEVAVVEPNQTPQNSDWKTESFVISKDAQTFITALSPKDITGDGINFIKPPIKQISAVATVNNATVDDNWNNDKISTTANVDYLSFDLWMRTTGPGKKVILDGSTYFGPLDPNQSYENSSAGYTPNAVIGAARLAILNEDFDTRKLLWIPAPWIYYDGTALYTPSSDGYSALSNTANTFGLFYTADNANHDIHTDGTYNHGYYLGQNDRNILNYSATPGANTVTANTTFKDYTLPQSMDLSTLSGTLSGTDYKYNKVRINVWVEGEDPESRSAQIGGEFKLTLALRLENV